MHSPMHSHGATTVLYKGCQLVLKANILDGLTFRTTALSTPWVSSKDSRKVTTMKRLLSRRFGTRQTLDAAADDTDRRSIFSGNSGLASETFLERALKPFSEAKGIDYNRLRRDYKKLLRGLDAQNRKLWQNVMEVVKGDDVMRRLVETSGCEYPQEIRNLSHELILRFIIKGLVFDRESLEINESAFAKEHADYLANHYPAALLMAYTNASGFRETEKFLSWVNSTWHGSSLPGTCRKCAELLNSYVASQQNIADNIEKHAHFLASVLSETDAFDDISLFVGLFPWMYFKLDPLIDSHSDWLTHGLIVDDAFTEAVRELFQSRKVRTTIIRNLGAYYSQDEESNTPLQLLMYLWALDLFQFSPKSLEYPVPDAIQAGLISTFEPGRWMAQTYYVCTRGETLVRGMEYFTGEKGQATLARFIALNLSRWDQIKRNVTLDYGMTRTLFLALCSCGPRAFFDNAREEEYISLAWHIAQNLRNPSESSIPRSEAPSIVVTEPSASVMHDGDELTLDTRLTAACSEIPATVSDIHQRKTLKMHMYSAILRGLILAGPHDAVCRVCRILSSVAGESNVSNLHVSIGEPLKALIVSLRNERPEVWMEA